MIREVPGREWDELLDIHGLTDAYLSNGYVSASAILDPGEAKLLVLEVRDGGVAFPLLVRPILHEPELCDVTSPYGYGGPVGFGAVPPWKAFHAAYERWCTDNRIVTTFVRFHPLYGNQRDAAPSMNVESEAGTVGWRIEAGHDLIAQLAKHHQRQIHRTGHLTVVQRAFADEGVTRFQALYTETMRRVGATSFYHFPDIYWEALRTGLGRKLSLAEVVDEEGSVLAAALLLVTPPWLHYHLGASTEEGRHVGATVRLFLDVARAAQEAGFRVFHLGGGRGGSADSLLTFKRRFDPEGLLEAAVGKQIHNPTEYRRLTGVGDTSGYFPRYRMPDGTESSNRGSGLSFRLVSPRDLLSLAEVFSDIDDTFFHPHPFTTDEARRLVNYAGRDVYALLADSRSPVAYGMLRGWDEGYETPSLGIAVRTSAQGKGFGRQMMGHLHTEARRRGADRVRLRVHPENVPARRLYESFGYVYSGEDRGELLMFVELGAQGSPMTGRQ